MVQIVMKTSEQCDGDADFETMCSLTPVESYVAMYGVMIGGVEISSISDLSPLVIALIIAATVRTAIHRLVSYNSMCVLSSHVHLPRPFSSLV